MANNDDKKYYLFFGNRGKNSNIQKYAGRVLKMFQRTESQFCSHSTLDDCETFSFIKARCRWESERRKMRAKKIPPVENSAYLQLYFSLPFPQCNQLSSVLCWMRTWKSRDCRNSSTDERNKIKSDKKVIRECFRCAHVGTTT